MKIEHGKTEKKNSLEVSGRHVPELLEAVERPQPTGCGVRGTGKGAHSSSPKKLPVNGQGLLGSLGAALSLLLLLQTLLCKGHVHYTR